MNCEIVYSYTTKMCAAYIIYHDRISKIFKKKKKKTLRKRHHKISELKFSPNCKNSL